MQIPIIRYSPICNVCGRCDYDLQGPVILSTQDRNDDLIVGRQLDSTLVAVSASR